MLCSLDLHKSSAKPMNDDKRIGLHWRKKPPKWGGSIEEEYCRAYPDMVQELLCFNCGAIPCPYDHVETAKQQRLADTKFIRELASERGEIRHSIKKIREEMEAMKKREGLLIIDKELLQNRIKLLEKQKSEWMHAETMMHEEIRRLTSMNEQKKNIIDKVQNERLKLKQLQQKLNAVEEENKILRGENEIYRKQLLNYTNESSSLVKQRDALAQELEKSNSKVKALIKEVTDTKEELKSAKNTSSQLQGMISDMESKVKSIEEEMLAKENYHKEKEDRFDVLLKKLNSELLSMKDANSKAENTMRKQRNVIEELTKLAGRLKRRLSDDSRFQQFVEVKRDYDTLKDITSTVLQKLQEYEFSNPLPAIEENGNVIMTSMAYGQGARSDNSILIRPKCESNKITNSKGVSDGSSTSSGISSR